MDRRELLRKESPEKPKLPPSEQNTAELIDGVSKLQIQRSPTRNLLPPQWESTASYLGADLAKLNSEADRRKFTNISESTVFFDENLNPISPLRRSLSETSVDMYSKDTQEIDPFTQRRSVSAPDEHKVVIDFDIFYDGLTMLPRTARYIHFKGILSRYLEVLNEHGVDPSNDRFVITIYNQIRSPFDHSKLEKVVDVFLESPSNEAMKLSHFLYFKDLKLQSKLFKLWVIKRRKLTEIRKSEVIWEIYTRKKFMSKWIFRHSVITEDFEENAQIFLRMKSLLKFWDIWRSNIEEKEEFERVADLQVKAKLFNQWKSRLVDQPTDAESTYEKKLSRRVLKQWRLKTIESQSRLQQKRVFSQWKNKLDSVRSLTDDACDLEMVFHAGFFFTKWKKRYETVDNKEQDLDVIYKAHVLQKYFSIWAAQLDYKLLENEVHSRREFFLKQFVMGQFKKRFVNEQRAAMLAQSYDLRLGQRVLKNWHLKLISREGERALVLKFLELWKKKHQLLQRSKDADLLIKSKIWENWNVKLMKHMNSLELSTSAFESYTKVIYLKNWMSAVESNRELDCKAIEFTKANVLKRWKKRVNDRQDLEKKAVVFHSVGSSALILKTFFQKWTKKYDDKRESQLSKKLPVFERSMDTQKKKIIFKIWKDSYQMYLDQEAIFKDDFLKELYTRPLFQRWRARQLIVQQMEKQADDVNNWNLISSGFTKMQLALVRVQELDERLVELEEDKQLKLVLKYLNTWSLQVMKSRRDNEVVAQFQSRWNRAHLRAILLLWQGKTADAQSKRQIIAESSDYEPMVYGEDNTTEIFTDGLILGSGPVEEDDDDSPTKFKGRVKSPFLGLETPRKAIVNGFSTNTRASSIPGSERIRRRRIDALKSHYSQIKYAIPSPLKNPKVSPVTATPLVLNPTPKLKVGSSSREGTTKKLDFGDLKIFRNHQ